MSIDQENSQTQCRGMNPGIRGAGGSRVFTRKTVLHYYVGFTLYPKLDTGMASVSSRVQAVSDRFGQMRNCS